MKVHELRIQNIRGIRSLQLNLDGKSCVVWGQNGTGKSAVVDALDFLLTGTISRLEGRQGISTRKHGKHIDAKPEEVFVEATVCIPEIADLVTIRRRLSNSTVLEVPDGREDLIEKYAVLAARRQHMLTRADILRFISLRPGERAEVVESLLNLENIGRLRQVLVRAKNDSGRSSETKIAACIRAEGGLGQLLGVTLFQNEKILEELNRLRVVLKADPITELRGIKDGIEPPEFTESAEGQGVKLAEIEQLLLSVGNEELTRCETADGELRTCLDDLQTDPATLRRVNQVRLVETGIELLDGGACPLCDTAWDESDLRRHLDSKVSQATEAKRMLRLLDKQTRVLLEWVGIQPESVERLILCLPASEIAIETEVAAQYVELLRALSQSLANPLRDYRARRATGESLREHLTTSDYQQWLESVRTILAAGAPESDPRRMAWDTLTQAEVLVAALHDARAESQCASMVADRASDLLECFQSARESVLGELYGEVRDRFVELYQSLHEPDEAGFLAQLEPTNTGVTLDVGFHERCMASPMALHSEGHQDSMGLCLFLALSERVMGDALKFRLLDDVVMSVDAGHRKRVAKLIATLGEQTQFILTSHDRVWVSQLKAIGAVESRQIVQLLNWSLETGPIKECEREFWNEIEQYLGQGNIRAAAALLRHGLERFFAFAAESLGARVRFSMEGQWDFGDVFGASLGKLKELLREAKGSARSWDQAERLAVYEGLDTQRSERAQAVQAEQWMVNSSVHFNAWNDLGVEEFRDVVIGFRGLCGLFGCASCGCPLATQKEGATPVAVSCPCGTTHWNLQRKPAET